MADRYLEKEGLLYLWQKIKNLFTLKGDAIKNITRSGTTFTAIRADGTTFEFDQQDSNTTYGVVSKTAPGLAPQLPNETTTNKYLRQDGSWAVPPNTTYTPAGTAPKMDGTAAVGTSAKYAREDHVHPSDTTKVPTSRKVNGKALSADITLSASDVSAIPASQKGAASGICPLNASGQIDAAYLPSFVDDAIEAYARPGQPALSKTWLATGSASGTVITPEGGKIYILMADSGDYSENSQFRWTGSAYVKMLDGGVSSITNAEIDEILAT